MKTKRDLIFRKLFEGGGVWMSNSDSILSIHLHESFDEEKVFLFILNHQPIFSTKREWYAVMKLEQFIDEGFELDKSYN